MIDETIKLGTVGKIVFGDNTGDYIKIEEDSKNTGGFLIHRSASVDFKLAGDDWVENKDHLRRYFEESRWRIEWLKDGR